MKKKFKWLFASVIALAFLVVVASFTVLPVSAEEMPFSDVKTTDFFYEGVKDLANRDVINGYDDGTFLPNNNVTRAQASKIVALALGLDIENVNDPGFKDVKSTDWHYGYISALVSTGILDGYKVDNTFRPNETLTRAQMSKILSLAFHLKEENKDLPFTDVKKSDWFAGYVGALLENGITTGTTPTTYSPNRSVTRGQLATFIYRAEQAEMRHKIESVTEAGVIINGRTYEVDNSLKGLFSPSNHAVLQNAEMKLEIVGTTIKSVRSLEVTPNGESTETIFLNGAGATIDGDVTINADFITITQLKVTGDFIIGKHATTNIYSNNLSVSGKTIISDDGKMNMNRHSMLPFQQVIQPKITFEGSNLGEVQLKRSSVLFEAIGNTTIDKIDIMADTTLRADKSVTLSSVTIGYGAKQVEVNAVVDDLSINTSDSMTLSGSGEITNIQVNDAKLINLHTDTPIKNLVLKEATTKITLGDSTKIDTLTIPFQTKIEDVIEGSYENKVKETIVQPDPDENTPPDIEQPDEPTQPDPAEDNVLPGTIRLMFEGGNLTEDVFVHVGFYHCKDYDKCMSPKINRKIVNGALVADIIGLDGHPDDTYTVSFSNSEVTITELVSVAEARKGTLKVIDIGEDLQPFEINHPFISDIIETEIRIRRHEKSTFGTPFVPGAKIHPGTYDIEYSAKGEKASSYFYKEDFVIDSTNRSLTFFEEEISKVIFDLERSPNIRDNWTDNYWTAHFSVHLPSKENRLIYGISAGVHKNVKTLYVTKGEYPLMGPRYMFEKNNEAWSIDYSLREIDLKKDQTFRLSDQLKLNIKVKNSDVSVSNSLSAAIDADVVDDYNTEIAFIYSRYVDEYGYYRTGDPVNGTLTLEVGERTFSTDVHQFNFTHNNLRNFFGDEILNHVGQKAKLIFEVKDSPIPIPSGSVELVLTD